MMYALLVLLFGPIVLGLLVGLLMTLQARWENRRQARATRAHGTIGAQFDWTKRASCTEEKRQTDERAARAARESAEQAAAERAQACGEWISRIRLPEYLKSMHPQQFEHLVCELFRRLGHEVEPTRNFSGWRISEMRGLEWRDVDLAGHVVRLRPELSKNKDGRVLPLSDELLELIERAAERRRLDCLHVFHVDGHPIGVFRKSWARACITAGLGAMVTVETPAGPKRKYHGLIPHDFRRSAVRNMVRAGIPERVCMALSGHKSRDVFERYNIVSEADLTDAADKLHMHLSQQPPARVLPMKQLKKAG